jgi:hypothetical protein
MDSIKKEDIDPELCHQCIANHVEKHIQVALKLANLCKWSEAHEKEIANMKEKLEKRFEAWEGKQTGILVSVILLLIAAVVNMGFHLIK